MPLRGRPLVGMLTAPNHPAQRSPQTTAPNGRAELEQYSYATIGSDAHCTAVTQATSRNAAYVGIVTDADSPRAGYRGANV